MPGRVTDARSRDDIHVVGRVRAITRSLVVCEQPSPDVRGLASTSPAGRGEESGRVDRVSVTPPGGRGEESGRVDRVSVTPGGRGEERSRRARVGDTSRGREANIFFA